VVEIKYSRQSIKFDTVGVSGVKVKFHFGTKVKFGSDVVRDETMGVLKHLPMGTLLQWRHHREAERDERRHRA
jgi:hypothetical protein